MKNELELLAFVKHTVLRETTGYKEINRKLNERFISTVHSKSTRRHIFSSIPKACAPEKDD